MALLLTITEIAGALGVSDRAVRKLAQKDQWQAAGRRKGAGGGTLYDIDRVPLTPERHKRIKGAVRRGVIGRLLAAGGAAEQPPATKLEAPPPAVSGDTPALPTPSSLKNWQRQRMDARLAFVRLIEQAVAAGSGVNAAIEEVVDRAHARTLPPHLQTLVSVANARVGKDGDRTLSVRSLKRWRGEFEKAGGNYVVLAPKNVDGPPPVWGPVIDAAMGQPRKPTLREATEIVNAQGFEVSYSQAWRYRNKLGEIEKNRGRMGAKELASIRPFRRRDTSNLLPGDIYTADGQTFDAEVAHPYHGRPFRPEITLVLDVATRMPVGWSVSLAESAVAVVDALRHACETHGIPAIFYTDNGPGYKADMLTEVGTGLLSRLGITAENSIPGRSQSRGIIERGIQTILVKAARSLPTYIGKTMDREARQLAYKATRKEVRATGKGEVVKFERRVLPTWNEFIALVEAAIADYCDRPHRSLPRYRDVTGAFRHYSPNEMWQKAVASGWEPVMPEGACDLYHPQEVRRVVRGEVRLWNNVYASADLAEHHGREVIVSYDIHDASFIWVRQFDGRLIARARLDGNLSDYFPLAKVEQDRERRADGRVKRLERKIEEIEMERKGPAIEVTAIHEPAIALARQALAVEMAAPPPTFVLPASDKERYQLWKQIDRRGAATEEEQRFYAGFRNSAAWRSWHEMEQEFGLAAK